MNLEKRFNSIRSFLATHQYLHELEVLERYPEYKSPYHDWAKQLQTLSLEEKRAHENNDENNLITNHGYLEFLNTIKELQEIPKENYQCQNIPQELNRKMSKKKQHELGIIKQQLDQHHFEHYIDIGSGAGHLSSYLLWQNEKTSDCLDMSEEFQKIGKDKFTKYLPELLKRLNFETLTFTPTSQIRENKHSAIIGLHACGDLSVAILKKYLNSKVDGILNYGCCYHKLSPDCIHLSRLAKEIPLILTNHSLTMAAKSYKPKSPDELDFRDKVKLYRYGLHIYLKDHFKKGFVTLGNATKEDYQGSFSDYALKYAANQLGKTSKEELENFIKSHSTQDKIDYLMCLGIIRSKLARLIEIYIILDRALYLKEKNVKVEIKETFDPNLSPRNISILGCRNH